VDIAGKTGTAQVVSEKKGGKKPSGALRDHAWFVAYAPAADPQIAISVFVEHGGHGGTASAPIAKAVIEEYYKKGVQGAEGQRGQVTNNE
jgi:penicillin-binding protein 2